MHFKSALTFFAYVNALYVEGNEYYAVDTKWIWMYFMNVYENYMYEDAGIIIKKKLGNVKRKFYGIKYIHNKKKPIIS